MRLGNLDYPVEDIKKVDDICSQKHQRANKLVQKISKPKSREHHEFTWVSLALKVTLTTRSFRVTGTKV